MLRVDLKPRKVVVKDSTYLATIAVLVLILVSLYLQVDSGTKKASTMHAITIEEREAVYTVIEKMEREPRLKAFASWLVAALNKEGNAVLVSTSRSGQAVELKSEGTLIFSQKFFNSDPVTQELALMKVLADAGNFHSSQHPPSELAILPH